MIEDYPVLEDYPDLLTADDMAKILRVHKNTIYEQMRKGELHHVKIGRRVYVPKKWLLKKMQVA